MVADRTLRAAEEIEVVARRYDLVSILAFGDLFEAFEIVVSRALGQSVPSLVRQDEYRLVREIHQVVVGRHVDERAAELERRAMAVVFAREKWNLDSAVDALAKFLLKNAPDGAEAHCSLSSCPSPAECHVDGCRHPSPPEP